MQKNGRYNMVGNMNDSYNAVPKEMKPKKAEETWMPASGPQGNYAGQNGKHKYGKKMK